MLKDMYTICISGTHMNWFIFIISGINITKPASVKINIITKSYNVEPLFYGWSCFNKGF